MLDWFLRDLQEMRELFPCCQLSELGVRKRKGLCFQSKRFPNIPSAACLFSGLDSKNAEKEKASSLGSAGMPPGRSSAASVCKISAVE